jgi:hypothetical protein
MTHWKWMNSLSSDRFISLMSMMPYKFKEAHKWELYFQQRTINPKLVEKSSEFNFLSDSQAF